MAHLVLMDDSLAIQKVVRLTLAGLPGTEIVACQTPARALERLRQQPVDLVLAYVRFCGEVNVDFFQTVRQSCPRVLLLAESDDVTTALAQEGFTHVLRKPFHSEELRTMVDKLLALPLGAFPPALPRRGLPDDVPISSAERFADEVFGAQPSPVLNVPRPAPREIALTPLTEGFVLEDTVTHTPPVPPPLRGAQGPGPGSQLEAQASEFLAGLEQRIQDEARAQIEAWVGTHLQGLAQAALRAEVQALLSQIT